MASLFRIGAVSVILFFALQGCAFKFVHRNKHIIYTDQLSYKREQQELNIFAPAKHKQLKPVLIFVYGGNWNSGNKKIYNFFGTRWARKEVVTVIVDYPKSPVANYDEMATDVTTAVHWVSENISRYGGDSNRIFISGHSAGGHLAALISIKKTYFEKAGITNPIKGLILIDAAGLDMYGYLMGESFEEGDTYLNTFTSDPKIWKEASPLYYLHPNIPPMLIYRGSKTYPSIIESNEKFVTALRQFDTTSTYHILKGKKHVPMILQFFNTGNRRYKEIKTFMHLKIRN